MQVKIGPCLPYNDFAHCVVEVINPSEYDTELYNLEFDNLYLFDEEILSLHEELDQPEN